MFCPKCGKNVPEEFNFCFNCGFDLTALKGKATETNEQAVFSNAEPLATKSNGEERVKKKEYSDLKTSEVSTTRNVTYLFPDLPKDFDLFKQQYLEALYCNQDFNQAQLMADEYIAKFGEKESFKELPYYNNTLRFIFAEKVAETKNLVQALHEEVTEGWINEDFKTDFDEFIELSSLVVNDGYWVSSFFRRYFNVLAKQYEINLFFHEYDQLNEQIAANNDSNSNNDSYYKQIADLEATFKERYDCDIRNDAFYSKTSEAFDLDHIQIDLNDNLDIYSYYISEIYKWILGNAIRLHNADYLQALYPTREQENQYAGMVQNKFRSSWSVFTPKIPMVSKANVKMVNIQGQIDKLRKTFDSDSLLKDGALTFGLAFLSGPMGIANALRQGYNYYQSDEKMVELNKQLGQEYDNFCQELDALSNAACDAAGRSQEGIDELTKKYLVPAISNIFITLKKHGETLQPFGYYINA